MLSRTGLLRNGFSRTTNRWPVRRQFHEHMFTNVVTPRRVIDSPAAGRTVVDECFAFLEKQELLVERPGRLAIFTWSEYWGNWHLREEKLDSGVNLTVERRDAGAPLPKAVFQAMVDRTCELAWRLPPGFLFVFGNLAVDTGAVDGHKTIGANVGWILESGSPGDLVVVNKANFAEEADNWSPRFIPRTRTSDIGGTIHPGVEEEHFGPYALTVFDPKTGDRHGYDFYTCLDMIAGPHPEGTARPRTLVANNAGTPHDWQAEWIKQNVARQGDTVVVSDSVPSRYRGADGVFDVDLVQRQVHPWLSPSAPAALHDVLLWFFHRVLGVQLTEATVTELGYKPAESTMITDVDTGIKAVVTAPRPIPTLPADEPAKTGTGD